jgi:hypothetical protein
VREWFVTVLDLVLVVVVDDDDDEVIPNHHHPHCLFRMWPK